MSSTPPKPAMSGYLFVVKDLRSQNDETVPARVELTSEATSEGLRLTCTVQLLPEGECKQVEYIFVPMAIGNPETLPKKLYQEALKDRINYRGQWIICDRGTLARSVRGYLAGHLIIDRRTNIAEWLIDELSLEENLAQAGEMIDETKAIEFLKTRNNGRQQA
jgi:hypothetical protein